MQTFAEACTRHSEALLAHIRQQRLAAANHVFVRRFEIAREPRVGHAVRRIGISTVGILEQLVHFALRIAFQDAAHIANVLVIHADEQVVFSIIGHAQLHGGSAWVGDAVRVEHPLRTRMRVIADFIVGRRARRNDNAVAQTRARNHVAHHELSHSRSANIAVADEHDAMDKLTLRHAIPFLR